MVWKSLMGEFMIAFACGRAACDDRASIERREKVDVIIPAGDYIDDIQRDAQKLDDKKGKQAETRSEE